MPSFLHEGIADLFRRRVTLAAELWSICFGGEVPAFTSVHTDDIDLTHILPTELRADVVVVFEREAPVFGIIVEVQLSTDTDKLAAWPAYVAGLAARKRIPVLLLVVAPSPRVARWAAKPRSMGPGFPWQATVLGPSHIPRITDVAAAVANPELSVLSALASLSVGGDAKETLLPVAEAITTLDQERATLYLDLIFAAAGEAMRKELLELMRIGKYEIQTEFIRKNFELGRAQGIEQGRETFARVLVQTLAHRGIALSDEERARIESCAQLDRLELWFNRAWEATTAAEVFADD